MTNSTSTMPWTLRMPAGSRQQWTIGFTTTAPGGTTPYSITGLAWKYVARTSATDLTVPPLIEFDTNGNSQGIITVTATSTTSSLLLTIYPAATASLTPGTYFHSLWAQPGTSAAVNWFDGLLLIDGAPQP